MPYIQPVNRASVDAATATKLDAVQAKLGRVPNMFLTLAQTPVALDAYLELSGVAATGRLSATQREQIALVVGETNACGYCVAAHGAIGKLVGLEPAQIAGARLGQAADAKTTAVLALARSMVDSRGHPTLAELDAFKAAGFGDAEILEVLVNVVLNIYTNYTNHIAGTEIDFPVAAPARAA